MSTFHVELQHIKFFQQSDIQTLTRKLTGKNQFRTQKSVIHYSPNCNVTSCCKRQMHEKISHDLH